jgi:hypothetical protein
MSTWFSEYRVRTLAEHIAPRIQPKVEAAIAEVFRAHMPGLLMEAIRAEIGFEHAPKGSAAARRDRDNLIRSRFNGRNAVELAGQFGLSVKQVVRIGRGVK